MMDMSSAPMRDLARRLLAVEAASQSAADPHVHEAVRVCEKLRISLTRFAGADGFAVAPAAGAGSGPRGSPFAARHHGVKADGSVEGLEELAADASKRSGGDAAVAITAHLLGLLVTFIGEPLTLRLVREAWPDASLDE